MDRVGIKAHVLLLVVLIEGFISVAVEIIAIRQLLPVAGGSVIVTSLIIGIFLLFLALGYRRGGSVKTNLTERLSRNFFISAIWLGIGLSYIFIATFFYLIQKLVGFYIFYPLVIYLFCIIAPLIYLLGQTIPITMNMASKNKAVGMIGGNTLSLSTIGSFLGATTTSLLFMHYFGVAWTIVMDATLLLCLFILLLPQQQLLSWFLFASVSVLIYGFNVQTEHNLFVKTNSYANYQIFKTPQLNLQAEEKIFSINNSLSSFTNKNNKAFNYIEVIKKILFEEMALNQANILIIGAGGFTLTAENTHNNQITYIDIDDQLKAVATPEFVKTCNGELIVDDARHFVSLHRKQYEAIVVDAYTNIRAIPSYLLTYEFMQELKQNLKPAGTIIFNIVANPTLADPYSKRIDNTIRAAFNNCMANPLHYGNRISNILYICSNTTKKDTVIYTDNRNTSTTDSFEW